MRAPPDGRLGGSRAVGWGFSSLQMASHGTVPAEGGTTGAPQYPMTTYLPGAYLYRILTPSVTRNSVMHPTSWDRGTRQLGLSMMIRDALATLYSGADAAALGQPCAPHYIRPRGREGISCDAWQSSTEYE